MLGRDIFVATFGHLYPLADLAAFLAITYTPEAFDILLSDRTQRFWIARQNGRAMGYAQAGPCGLPHPDVTRGCGELKRLYVRAEAQGGGLGGALLETALAWLRAPKRKLWIGVWSENFGAQRLYGRHGRSKSGNTILPSVKPATGNSFCGGVEGLPHNPHSWSDVCHRALHAWF